MHGNHPRSFFKNVNSQATPGDSNSVGFGGAQEFLLLTNSLVSSSGHSNTERLPGGVKKPGADKT